MCFVFLIWLGVHCPLEFEHTPPCAQPNMGAMHGREKEIGNRTVNEPRKLYDYIRLVMVQLKMLVKLNTLASSLLYGPQFQPPNHILWIPDNVTLDNVTLWIRGLPLSTYALRGRGV